MVVQRNNRITDEKRDRLVKGLYAWKGNKVNFNNITGQNVWNLRENDLQAKNQRFPISVFILS